MAIKTDREFRLFLRRPAGPAGRYAIRYSVEEGYGLLSLHGKGKAEGAPASSGETHDLDSESLRGGRFVHVLPSGNKRQSYSLERLAQEVLHLLPEDRWVELETLNEFGFRYLVPPGDQSQSTVTIPPRSPSPAAAQPTAAQRLASSGGPPPRAAAPAVAARPAQSDAAIASLPPAQAMERLREELARNADLMEEIAELQTRLNASLRREQDLIEVLGRWQEREIGK